MVVATTMQKPALRGRTAERNLIDGLLREATAGRGGALLIRGEPGTGKSTLLTHIAAGRTNGRTSGRTAGAVLHTVVLRTAGVAEEAALPYAALQRFLQPVRAGVAALPP